jgi:hypothetical protein
LFSRSKVCNWLRTGHLMSFERLLSGPFFDWLRAVSNEKYRL